ncbi:MAG TPA: flavin reductase family protein [Solirubrobacterales bacterium]|jgi:3-hydroxy-9,10-secoandrosta-1,3,5(10)-triene-9,17-dione monooxygenase reductase component|nr:flavin reductase family protein [Solirubrobacterales bacterium]HMU26535.1 flavin reductase family protein [Solirubrobacterales bacterium]HMW45291.1 flavin reductase family protein [Solirubrobacterales bacterium]HMX71819.1 flavin reductase family protein [Solirubrobacterales bacterium]HMY26754.1 flavin reductase family protein [Solirubrobacterales bacterium]
MAAPDRNEFRQTVGLLPTGVTVVSAFQASGPAGATASAVCSLSLEPMMMLVCLDLGSRSLEAVREAGRFGISVLGESQRAAAEMFATKADQEEKWSSVVWREHLEVPIIEGSLARVVCDLAEVIPGGDHVIVTGEVLEVEAEDEPGEPLIYHGGLFRRLDAQQD